MFDPIIGRWQLSRNRIFFPGFDFLLRFYFFRREIVLESHFEAKKLIKNRNKKK